MARRQHRVRRVAKWTGLAVVCSTGALWLISMTSATGYSYGLSREVQYIMIGRGCVDLRRDVNIGMFFGPVPRPGWATWSLPPDTAWWPCWSFNSLADFWVRIPLWTAAFMAALPTTWLWWRDRRARPGHCSCSYALAGLGPDTPCPECGRKAA